MNGTFIPLTSAVVALLAAVTFAGCGGDTKPTGGPASDPLAGGGPTTPEQVAANLPGGPEFAAGKTVYANNKCANCHKLGETGGGGGKGPMPGGPMPGGPGPGGPNLSTVGAAPEHTKAWLADHIRDPKKHQPNSRMPAYPADKLSDVDLDKLAEYLASRK